MNRKQKKTFLGIGIFVLSLFCSVLFAEEKSEATDVDILNKKVSMDFLDAKLKDVLKIITQQTGLNFIVNGDILETKISMFLDKVTIKEALNSIALAYNLDFSQVPDTAVVRVKPKVFKESDARITRVYKLKYVKVTPLKLIDDKLKMSEESVSAAGFVSVEDKAKKEQAGIITSLMNLLSPDGILSFDDRTNMIIVTDYADRFARIEEVIALLDKKMDQVLIKAELIELADNLNNVLGLSYGQTDGTFGTFSGAVVTHGWPFQNWNDKNKITEAELMDDTLRKDNLLLGKLSAAEFTVVLKALSNSGKAKFLSRPRILTLDSEPAIVNITANAAIERTVETDQETKVQTYSYTRQDVGITLKVTPQINGNKENISLFVEPTLSRPAQSTLFPEVLDVQTRKVRTKVMLKNGETVAIGGLISKEEKDSARKVPILGDIPILGTLFSSKNKDNASTDLLIFITPSIIDDENMDYLHKKPEDDWTLDKEREKDSGKKKILKDKDRYKEENRDKKEGDILEEKTLTSKIKEYEEAVHKDPNDASTHSNLGVAYAKSGQYDRAIDQFKKSILLMPSSASAYNNLGNLYRIKKEYKAAITCLKRAVQLEPEHPYAYTTMGLCYEMRDMYDEAKEAYQLAIKYAPNAEWTNTARERLIVLESAV